jgi:hypothetical protein
MELAPRIGRSRSGSVKPRLNRIISGGQTGADQAGLKATARLGIPTGGVMPKDFLTEDGPRPDLATRYGLAEAESPAYAARTERNVLLADGTVVFAADNSPGSRLTVGLCQQHGKPCLEIPCDLTVFEAAMRLREWLGANAIRTLNVAGGRESQTPGVGAFVAAVIEEALREK